MTHKPRLLIVAKQEDPNFTMLANLPYVLASDPSAGAVAKGAAAILHWSGTKEIPRMRRNQSARNWAPFDVEMIAGKVLGIVGYGDIGRTVATRAHAMGM